MHAEASAMPPERLRVRVRGKHGLLCVMTDPIDRTTIDAGAALRVIATIAVGYDNIDVPHARSRRIEVTNTPDVLTEAVAEYTWGLILAVTRRIVEGDRLIRAGGWRRWTLDFMHGSELRGRRLGIIGMGRIGRAVAARAAAFGMEVVCASRGGQPGSALREPLPDGVSSMSVDELLVSADIVSLHVPQTPATRHLVDRRALARMKRSAYLVNTARGSVVDEAALVWALDQRLIAGAALDVFESEPHIHPDLLRFENVVLVPHLGSATTQTRTSMMDLAASNLLAVLAGDPPLTPV